MPSVARRLFYVVGEGLTVTFQTQQALAMDAVANMLNTKPTSKTDEDAS